MDNLEIKRRSFFAMECNDIAEKFKGIKFNSKYLKLKFNVEVKEDSLLIKPIFKTRFIRRSKTLTDKFFQNIVFQLFLKKLYCNKLHYNFNYDVLNNELLYSTFINTEEWTNKINKINNEILFLSRISVDKNMKKELNSFMRYFFK